MDSSGGSRSFLARPLKSVSFSGTWTQAVRSKVSTLHRRLFLSGPHLWIPVGVTYIRMLVSAKVLKVFSVFLFVAGVSCFPLTGCSQILGRRLSRLSQSWLIFSCSSGCFPFSLVERAVSLHGQFFLMEFLGCDYEDRIDCKGLDELELLGTICRKFIYVGHAPTWIMYGCGTHIGLRMAG